MQNNSNRKWTGILAKGIKEDISEMSRADAFGGSLMLTATLASIWILSGPIGAGIALVTATALSAQSLGKNPIIDPEYRKADIAQTILSLPLLVATTYGSALRYLAKGAVSLFDKAAGVAPWEKGEETISEIEKPVPARGGVSSLDKLLEASVSFNALAPVPVSEIMAADVAQEQLKAGAPAQRM